MSEKEVLQRLGRAAYEVDSTHHFGYGDDGLTCLCGFQSDARKRTQTEHITRQLIEVFIHD